MENFNCPHGIDRCLTASACAQRQRAALGNNTSPRAAAVLQAEVERLRAENETQRSATRKAHAAFNEQMAKAQKLKAENERLEAKLAWFERYAEQVEETPRLKQWKNENPRP